MAKKMSEMTELEFVAALVFMGSAIRGAIAGDPRSEAETAVKHAKALVKALEAG